MANIVVVPYFFFKSTVKVEFTPKILLTIPHMGKDGANAVSVLNKQI